MLETLSEYEFDEFSKNHEGGTFFQTSYWGELKKNNGWIPHIIGIKEGFEIKGATLLLAKKIPIFNKYIFYAPRGFLLNYKSTEFLEYFTKQVAKYVKKHHGIFFKINPYLMYQERDKDGNIVENGISNKEIVENLKKMGYKHNGFTITYGKDLEPRWLSVLDIKGKTEEEILKNMDRTTRWTVNNSYKHGLRLVEIDESRIHEYKKLMEHTGKRRGFIDRPLEYYVNMYRAFNKNNCIKIMLVELFPQNFVENLKEQKKNVEKNIEIVENRNTNSSSGQIKELKSQLESLDKRIKEMSELAEKYDSSIVVAGGLFMTFGKQVISLFGASYKEYMKYNGQYFLNYEMIKYAINNNYEKFNFFGITGEFNKESEMFGLFDFKRGFNAEVVELIGEFDYITNPMFNKIYEIMYSVYRKTKR